MPEFLNFKENFMFKNVFSEYIAAGYGFEICRKLNEEIIKTMTARKDN